MLHGFGTRKAGLWDRVGEWAKYRIIGPWFEPQSGETCQVSMVREIFAVQIFLGKNALSKSLGHNAWRVRIRD